MPFTITKNNIQTQLLEKTAQARKKKATEVSIALAASAPDQNDLVPAIAIAWIKTVELQPAARLVRKVTRGRVAKAVRLIKHFGFVSPIIIRIGKVVDGHTRLAAAKELGLTEVPCIDVSHLSAAKTKMLRLSLNRFAETGEWDLDELRPELEELKLDDYELTLSGFSDQELDIILTDDEGDEGPEFGSGDDKLVPVAKLGDLWLAGEHRVLCGDSLQAASYTRLMDGKLATLVQTDPPYNVKISNNVSGLGKKKHGEFKMASSEMTREQFAAFLNEIHGHIAGNLMKGGVAYVFIDWRSHDLVTAAGRSAGLEHLNTAVWFKGGGGGMGSFLRSAHEFCCIFAKGKTPAINNVQLGKHGRDRCNVWQYPGANRPGTSAGKVLKDHPTPKNVDMCVDAILDVSHEGDIVLDPFLGSGTALIAAERSRRVCHGIELDPAYVDVAIRRWEKLTGKDAVHAASGKTFKELESEEMMGVGEDDEDDFLQQATG